MQSDIPPPDPLVVTLYLAEEQRGEYKQIDEGSESPVVPGEGFHDMAPSDVWLKQGDQRTPSDHAGQRLMR